jgi:transposase
MARAYSLDLRERVVAAVASGHSCRSVAKTFMVSVASVVKWSQRQRAVGSPAALKMGGHRPYLVARERGWCRFTLIAETGRVRHFRALPETRLFSRHPNWDWRPIFVHLKWD